MKLGAFFLLILFPVIVIAETVSISVNAPTQTLTVEKKSVNITPEQATVEAVIHDRGTNVVTVAIPGPQGKPGSIAGLANVATSGSYFDLNNKPTIPSEANQIAYNGSTVATTLDQLLLNQTYIDGGSAGSIYLNTQLIDGGAAQ